MEQPTLQESETNPASWYDRLLLREGVDRSWVMSLEQVSDEPQWVVVINHETGNVLAGTLEGLPGSDLIRFRLYLAGEPSETPWDWSPADLGLCPRTPGGVIKADNRVYLPPVTPEE